MRASAMKRESQLPDTPDELSVNLNPRQKKRRMAEKPTTPSSRSPDPLSTVWTFNCGHRFSQVLVHESTALAPPVLPGAIKEVDDECPECRLKAEEIRKRQVNERIHAQEALEVYETQVNGIEKRIEDAAKAEKTQLKKELENMLVNCRILWPEQIVKVEKRAALDSGELNHKKTTFVEDLGMKTKKLRLLAGAKRQIKWKTGVRGPLSLSNHDGRADEELLDLDFSDLDFSDINFLDLDLLELDLLLTRCKQIQESCGSEVLEKVRATEEELDDAWKETIEVLNKLIPDA